MNYKKVNTTLSKTSTRKQDRLPFIYAFLIRKIKCLCNLWWCKYTPILCSCSNWNIAVKWVRKFISNFQILTLNPHRFSPTNTGKRRKKKPIIQWYRASSSPTFLCVNPTEVKQRAQKQDVLIHSLFLRAHSNNFSARIFKNKLLWFKHSTMSKNYLTPLIFPTLHKI